MECVALCVWSGQCFLLIHLRKKIRKLPIHVSLIQLGLSPKRAEYVQIKSIYGSFGWGRRSATHLISCILLAFLGLCLLSNLKQLPNSDISQFHSFIKNISDSNFSRALFILITASY